MGHQINVISDSCLEDNREKGVKASLIWGHAKVSDLYLWSVVGIEAYCFYSCNYFFELYMISKTNMSSYYGFV